MGSDPTAQPAPASSAAPRDTWAWPALILFMLIIAMLRIHLLGIPLERDEGEYAYMGKLLLEGSPPFQDAVNMKLPGTNLAYALIMAMFGKTTAGIHTGLLLVSLLSMLLLFMAVKRGFNPMIALVTAGVFGLMGVSAGVAGFAAHATHFVTLFVAAALLALILFHEKPRAWLGFTAGVLLGLAFLMKQQALFFPLFGALAVLASLHQHRLLDPPRALRDGGLLTLGVAIPYLLIVAWVSATGNFGQFWFWTVKYAGQYAAGAEMSEVPRLFKSSFTPLFSEFPAVWVLGIAGLVAVFFGRFTPWQKAFVVAFALLSFAAVVPGFYFRPHYFVVALPALSLLFAITLDVVASALNAGQPTPFLKAMPLLVLASVGTYAYSSHRGYYSRLGPVEVSRQIYGLNPFPEAAVIGEHLRQHSDASDKIAVLGSEPEIYFYADRRSASRHLYMYGMMEPQPYNREMQKQAIDEIEAARPKFIVYCRVATSWLLWRDSPRRLLEWADAYLHAHYEVIGVADVTQNDTRYLWYEETDLFDGQNHNAIIIYRRKAE
jgi:4-amino-4-deoxy-L-arabinose transferase-like glycosyltransferase